jgi:thiol-disulfide isomerase/thioredoxin
VTRLLVTCACACLLVAACGEGRVQEAPANARPSRVSPAAKAAAAPEDVQLTDPNRLLQRFDARDKKPRGLVVNIWASWCGSCKEEIPLLLGVRETFAKHGIEFAFVSADEPKAFPEAAALMRSWNGPLPVLALGGPKIGAFKRAVAPEWRGGIPATFLFDDTRKLRHLWEGPIVEHEISPILQGMLAGEAIDGVTRTAATPAP